MTDRTRVSTGVLWEGQYGYSRAIRVGNLIEVSGTTAVDQNGDIVGEGDMYAQARFVLDRIEAALVELGSGLGDVIRTRAFLSDFGQFDALARAHREAFGAVRPAATAVEAALIRSGLLVEIEATAVVRDMEQETRE